MPLEAGMYLYASCSAETYGPILRVGKDANGQDVLDIRLPLNDFINYDSEYQHEGNSRKLREEMISDLLECGYDESVLHSMTFEQLAEVLRVSSGRWHDKHCLGWVKNDPTLGILADKLEQDGLDVAELRELIDGTVLFTNLLWKVAEGHDGPLDDRINLCTPEGGCYRCTKLFWVQDAEGNDVHIGSRIEAAST